jgi:hypothetical protein
MKFVNDGHLGGYVAADAQYPNGDPMTYTPRVWAYLLTRFDVEHVVDVGCGEGHAVRWFLSRPRQLGVTGIEGCREAFDAPGAPTEHMLLADFVEGPAEVTIGAKTMVWSCEFVEHVEEEFSDNFLSLFAQADVVAMTHASPGQPGHHHVNCQPRRYWVDKLAALGFRLDQPATDGSRAIAPESHWRRSGLVFVKKS